MKTYAICEDLGPTYSLRLLADGETASRTIVLTDDEFEEYTKASQAFDERQDRLAIAEKGIARG